MNDNEGVSHSLLGAVSSMWMGGGGGGQSELENIAVGK